jgi:hypothetical protein
MDNVIKSDRTSYQIGIQFKKSIDYCSKFIDNFLPDNKIFVLPIPRYLVTPKNLSEIQKNQYNFYICPDEINASRFIWKLMRNGLAKSVIFDELRQNC